MIHIFLVEEVNKLVDRIINEIIKDKKLTIPEFPDVKIEELDKLKRDGNCVKTDQIRLLIEIPICLRFSVEG